MPGMELIKSGILAASDNGMVKIVFAGIAIGIWVISTMASAAKRKYAERQALMQRGMKPNPAAAALQAMSAGGRRNQLRSDFSPPTHGAQRTQLTALRSQPTPQRRQPMAPAGKFPMAINQKQAFSGVVRHSTPPHLSAQRSPATIPLPPPNPTRRQAKKPPAQPAPGLASTTTDPSAPISRSPARVDAATLHRWLTPSTLRQQFMLTEVLNPPMALRPDRADRL